MNELMVKVKRTSEYVSIILFFAVAFCSLLFYIGNFGEGFMPVVGNLFKMILQVGIWLVIPLCILTKRRSYARWAAVGVSLYWLITTLFSLFDDMRFAVEGNVSVGIAVGVFSFFVACALIAMIVFALLSVVRKDAKIKFISFLIYLGALLLFVILFCLSAAFYAAFEVDWNVYFSLICDCILIPFAMVFLAINFAFREEEFVIPWLAQAGSEAVRSSSRNDQKTARPTAKKQVVSDEEIEETEDDAGEEEEDEEEEDEEKESEEEDDE